MIDHGTRAGYYAHFRASGDGTPCEPCRRANNAYHAARRAGGGPHPPSAGTRRLVAECGTESGYKLHRRHYEAACSDCLAAAAKAARDRRARRKAQEAQ